MEIVDVDEHDSGSAALPPEEAARAIELAMGAPEVQERLKDHRFLVLFVRAAPEPSENSKETDPQTLPEVVVFDYTADRWLTIPVDLASNSVVPFTDHDPVKDGQPAIVQAEADEALTLALAHDEVATLVDDGFVPIPRPVRVGSGEVTCETSRCVLVILHSDAVNRSVLIQVDLGVQQVIEVYRE